MKKMNNKKNGNPVGSEDFTGDIRLNVKAVENYIQVEQLCLHLKTIDNLRISSQNWSESKGLVIIVSLKDCVPLGDVLRRMPLVGQVYKKKWRRNTITVVLNTSPAETMTPVLPVSGEATAA